MALQGYGLLIGSITGSRPQDPGHPHWLLMVQPKESGHPPYRVAVNLQSGLPSIIQYQIVDLGNRGTAAAKSLVKSLLALGATANFLPADANPALPRVDFVRGGIIDPTRFTEMPAGRDPLRAGFEATLAEAKTAGATARIAVFGTGTPVNVRDGGPPPTGYTGIDNIHMNQGARNRVNGAPHYTENGANQDGCVIFLLPTGARGFFVKFATQTTDTDTLGNPRQTGIATLDRTSVAIRRAIMPKSRKRGARSVAAPLAATGATASSAASTPSGRANAAGYVFADVDPNDASGQYIADDDGGTYKTPYVMTRSNGQTRGPVPTPSVYPLLDLSAVVGPAPAGYSKSRAGETINFDVIGDSGAPSQLKLTDYESKVTDLMTRDAQTSPPAFLFHVGDVVYFYGEENYYYSQFYEPFRAYPAPIFAIPGNHDGITYNDTMISLDAFQKAFCATTPGRWVGSGGLLRSTMTQPGVYFTLNAPLVSIVGLYSNCGESFGWLDEQQLLFLYQELIRLKALRRNELRAVILAIHHFPRWFPQQTPADPTSAAIDATCKKAGFWPDAVICGHAHLYQRVVRQDTGQDIPYVMTGAGGYGIAPAEELGKAYMAKLAPGSTKLGRVLMESGYVRASVTKPASGDASLSFQYHSVNQTSNEPDDVCTVNLRTHKLM